MTLKKFMSAWTRAIHTDYRDNYIFIEDENGNLYKAWPVTPYDVIDKTPYEFTMNYVSETEWEK